MLTSSQEVPCGKGGTPKPYGALSHWWIPQWGTGQAVPSHQHDGTLQRPSLEDTGSASGPCCLSHREGNQTTSSSPATGWGPWHPLKPSPGS